MNSEHLEVVGKGAASIAAWRKKNPSIALDLSGAEFSLVDLDDADLSGANLSEAHIYGGTFVHANLSGASFRKATLPYCQFIKTNLSNADFFGADLFESNLTGADLRGASFRNSDMRWNLIKFPILSDTDFSGAKLRGTIFADCDFADVTLTKAIMRDTSICDSNLVGSKGIAAVVHEGPSRVDFPTILKTCEISDGCVPPDLKVFLLSIGLPKQLIDDIPHIVAGIKYCSCFVAYGEPDKAFAERLKQDFVAKGVSCWVYSLDSTPGARTWGEITQRRREAEKMIVLCSAKSLIREGVLKEIEEQIDENPEKLVPVSLDDIWKHTGFLVRRGANDLKPFLLERNYANFTSSTDYEGEFRRLLRGIEKHPQ